MIPPYKRGISDIQGIKRPACIIELEQHFISKFFFFLFTLIWNWLTEAFWRKLLFLLEKGLFYKVCVVFKTLFFSVLRVFHYLLKLVSITLKDFSCLVNIIDSFKLKHIRLRFHLWGPKGMNLKGRDQSLNLRISFWWLWCYLFR